MIPEDRRPRLGVINSLRGLAILAVIHHHVFGPHIRPGWISIDIGGFLLPVSAPLKSGWLGVDLFFMLSGFVLFLPYATGARFMDSATRLKEYARRRFLRLMPLYYFNVLVCMAFVFHRDPRLSLFYVDALVMATATFPFVERLFLPVYNRLLWSLGLEIWFSVLFPLFVLLVRRFGMTPLLVGSLLLGLGVRLYAATLEAVPNSPYFNHIKDSLPGRLDEFIAGMALCSLYVRRGALSPRRALLASGAGAFLVLLACCLWDMVLLKSIPRLTIAFINDVLLGGFFLLTWGLLSLPPGLPRRIVTNPALQVIGMMCYSLYVWHGLVAQRWFKEPSHMNAVHVATFLAFIFVLSAMSYRFIEFGDRRDWRTLFRPAPD